MVKTVSETALKRLPNSRQWHGNLDLLGEIQFALNRRSTWME